MLYGSGCEKESTLEIQETTEEMALVTSSETSAETSEEAVQETSQEISEETSQEDTLTPYQYLNLSIGNAEELSFTYKVIDHEMNVENKGAFHRKLEKSVEIIEAYDESGQPIEVRELEYEGFVTFIMDEIQVVKRYPGSADDFLIYRMMQAAMGEPVVSEKDGYQFYEYKIPYEKDESILLTYAFYMKEGTLKKLDYSVDDFLAKTYEFSAFEQSTKDLNVFEYPENYEIETKDYPFSEEMIPPWWKNDGL